MKRSIWLAYPLLALVFLGLMIGCVQSVPPTTQSPNLSPVEAIPTQNRVYAVQLNNPTMAQLESFLIKDLCNKCRGNCVDRAVCLADNAFTAGFECYVVLINFEEGSSHVIVAFKTTDNGMVYIEPLYDMIVTVKVGEDYGKQLKEPGFIIKQIGVFP